MTPPSPLPREAVEAVIFDLDGVLISSIPIHYEAFRRTFAAEGRDFAFDDYIRLGAGASRDVLIRRVMGELDDAKLAEMMATKERHVRDCIAERGLPEIPGARSFVGELRRRGLATAVATASRSSRLLLEGARMDDLFSVVVDRNEVERTKPAPDLFLEAATRLGVDPGRCLVFEDSPAGVAAGLAAGMRVIALTTSEPPPRLSSAHWTFDSYDAIDLDRVLAPVD